MVILIYLKLCFCKGTFYEANITPPPPPPIFPPHHREIIAYNSSWVVQNKTVLLIVQFRPSKIGNKLL